MAQVTYRGVSYDTVEYANQPTETINVELTYRGQTYETQCNVSVPGLNHLEILRKKLISESRLHDAHRALIERS